MIDIETQNGNIGSLTSQILTTEDYSVKTEWITPLNLAMILWIAPGEIEQCNRLVQKDNLFMMFATARLWTMFDRAIWAHARGDDQTAYQLCIHEREFRTCDFFAWLLSNRIEGAPEFQLYWSEEQRDKVLTKLEKMLAAENSVFKTHPFQE